MNFLLQSPVNAPPQLEESGKINLRDWTMPTDWSTVMHRDTITLENGVRLKVSQSPNMPSDEVLALDDETLIWVANQGAFPEVWCLLFLRGLTEEVRAIAPMLSLSAFYERYKDEVVGPIKANLEGEQSAEWVEYYAASLKEYPIFKIALFAVEEKYREVIGLSYLEQFNDIKYLSQEQIDGLTAEQKSAILLTTMKEEQNDPGKRDIAIRLFTDEDTIPVGDAAAILKATNSSVTCGSLMACPPFYNDHDNAYNVVATWIRHCQNERIGTNQSVWYNQALGLELQHQFSLCSQFIKNMLGQPIGGVNTVSGFDSHLVKGPKGGIGQPIGL